MTTARVAALSAPAELPPAPLLTVIRLDPDHPRVREDRRDLCRMHCRIVSMLGLGADDPKGRELWAAPVPDRLLVQYSRPLDLRRLPGGYATGHATFAVQVAWPAGAGVRWALIGNPVRADFARGARGKVRALRDPSEVLDWARDRLSMLDHGPLWVRDEHVGTGRRPNGKTVTHRRVRIEGEATVRDPIALADAIVGGVGRGKAFGCGLLLVAAR